MVKGGVCLRLVRNALEGLRMLGGRALSKEEMEELQEENP